VVDGNIFRSVHILAALKENDSKRKCFDNLFFLFTDDKSLSRLMENVIYYYLVFYSNFTIVFDGFLSNISVNNNCCRGFYGKLEKATFFIQDTWPHV
jgi:hypothetical protein